MSVSILQALKLGPPAGPILAVVMGALGAVQLAEIASAKYAEGTEFVEQGNNKKGIDTVPAMLTIGEGVVKKSINEKIPKGFRYEWIPDAAKLWMSGGYSNYFINDNGDVVDKLDIIAENTSNNIIFDANGNIKSERKNNHFIIYS